MNTVKTNINIILNREENHLNLLDSDNAGGVFGNNAYITLVNYGIVALFSSVKSETCGGRTNEYYQAVGLMNTGGGRTN